VIAAAEPVAFGFQGFEGQRRVSQDAILPHAAQSDGRNHLSAHARAADIHGPIVSLTSILAAVRA
jgi:hypothetical protein